MRERLGLFLKQPSMDALVSMGGYSINYHALSQMEMICLFSNAQQKNTIADTLQYRWSRLLTTHSI